MPKIPLLITDSQPTVLKFFRVSLMVVLTGSIVFACIIFSQSNVNSTPRLYDKEADSSETAKQPELELYDATLDWGLDFTHEQRSDELTAITDTLGPGVCAFDYDNDGWTDLYFVGGSGSTRRYGRLAWWQQSNTGVLYKNMAGQYLADVTRTAKLDFTIHGMGCAVGDVDADGNIDLFITGVNANKLLRNTGQGSFEDVTDQSGILSHGWQTGAAFDDFNNDGLPDLYVPRYIRFEKDAVTFEAESGFSESQATSFKPELYDAEPNSFFVNKGNFQFEDVTDTYGLSNKDGRSLGAQWIDLNNDHWPDLIVTNQFPSPNQIYINQQGRTFSPAESKFNSIIGKGNHQILSLASNFSEAARTGFVTTGASKSSIQIFDLDARSNTYSEVAEVPAFDYSEFSKFTAWGSASGDFDSDGDRDIFIATGTITPDPSAPAKTIGQQDIILLDQSSSGYAMLPARYHTSSTPPTTSTPTALSTPSSSLWSTSARAAIVTDLNLDGAPEIIITANNGKARILNLVKGDLVEQNNNWISLSVKPHRDYDSAKITLERGGKTTAFQLSNNSGYLSQSRVPVHLGLGEFKSVDKLTISSLNGDIIFKDLPANYNYVVDVEKESVSTFEFAREESILSRSIQTLSPGSLVYLGLILAEANKPEYLKLIPKLWKLLGNDEQLQLISKIVGIYNASMYQFALLALESTSDTVQLAAIELLKDSEIEESVDPLIRHLLTGSPEIQCGIARAFDFFYREEEAVVINKYRGIKPLIQVLYNHDGSHNLQARACAAAALGASEKYPASLALYQLLKNSGGASDSLIASVIDAIANNREIDFESILVAMLDNTPRNAKTVASTLHTLSRISSDNVTRLAEEHIYTPLASEDISNKLYATNLLVELVTDQNRTAALDILQDDRINAPISRQLETAFKKSSIESESSKKLAAASLRYAQLSGASIRAPSTLPDRNVHPELYFQSRLTRSVIQSKTAQSSIFELFSELLTLEFVKARDVILDSYLPSSDKNQLLEKLAIGWIEEHRTKDSVLDNLDESVAANVVESILNNSGNEKEIVDMAVTHCADAELPIHWAKIENFENVMRLEQALECLFNPAAVTDKAENSEVLIARSRLSRAMNSKKTLSHIEVELLISAMAHDSFFIEQYAMTRIEQFSSDQTQLVLRAIQNSANPGAFSELMDRILNDPETEELVRLHAMWIAYGLEPDKILQKLKIGI